LIFLLEKKISSKWVFNIKSDDNGGVKYKARLVARGFTQVLGNDYQETFSPVVRKSNIHFLIALAAELDLQISHFDVCTAFLNDKLEEEIYMFQPEGFVQKGKENQVCKLKKAVYGLKQAS